MKHKLLKDLPWAKAGTIWEEVYPKAVRSFPYKQMKYFNGTEDICEEFPEDTFSDWFEEVDERWKPMEGERFFLVEAGGRVAFTKYQGCKYDDTLVDFGNCFKTAEQAERVAEQIKALLKEFHKNNP